VFWKCESPVETARKASIRLFSFSFYIVPTQKGEAMDTLPEDLTDCCFVHITLDSCRFDSAQIAKPPNLSNLGPLVSARTLTPYTATAHAAAWLGHFPSAHQSGMPYYNETVRQPFRIATGPERDANKKCGMRLEGTNILEGLRIRKYATVGFGGVSQFSSGSWLRTQFPWSDFRYFGPDMDEEPLAVRDATTFPLNNVPEILDLLAGQRADLWYFFLNDQASHYPYDWGEGISEELENKVFPYLKLNLRSHQLTAEVRDYLTPYNQKLHLMQVVGLMQYTDPKLGGLFRGLRKLTKRPIFTIVHGDHGEYFGEDGLYGHMHGGKYDMTVPLWIGMV
jgi:hypothetical protein